MLERIKAVIFDMDGTLIDSMWMWKDIDVEYLGRFHIAMPEGLQEQIEGMSFSETAAYFKDRFHIPDTVEQMKEDWNRMAWEKYERDVPLKPGVERLLSCLKGKGIKMGIATSNSRELTDLILNRHGIASFMESVRTSCEAKRGKPFPDIYELVARDLLVEPKDCLVFEDVVSGIRAGKSAGMKVCALYDADSARDEAQKRELADYYLNTFLDLEELRTGAGYEKRIFAGMQG